MAYQHGLYFTENATQLQVPARIDSGIVVAVGTAPKPSDKPILAYTLQEATEALGYSEDFEKYTLCEVMQSQFKLYNCAPVVFINVYNPDKNNEEVSTEITGESSFKLEGELLTDTIVVTTGGVVEAPTLREGTDYEVFEDEIFGDEEGESSEVVIFRLKNSGGTVNISYRTAATALGGSEYETEVTLNRMEQYYLPSDTVIESVVVTSGETIDTTANLDYKVEVGEEVTVVTVKNPSAIQDDKIKVRFKVPTPENVTAADIIGGIDAQTGKATGLELVNSIFPMFNLVAGIIIAPKYSLQSGVVAAMVSKAKSISGLFPAIAIADIDTEKYKTYQQAVEFKNSSNRLDAHLILTYPKVICDGVQYYLSTHLAGLINRTDADNGGLPYVSPSNQTLAIDGAVLADGTEVYLTRDQANFLNANGIGTVLSFVGLKYWGNYTSAYPTSGDPREVFIPVRRMFNYINATFIVTYISQLDQPINRRMIESVLQSANIYLNSLVAQGVLLGARLEFNEDDNATTTLMNGILTFRLYITPPSPAQALIFTMEIDTDYYLAIFAA